MTILIKVLEDETIEMYNEEDDIKLTLSSDYLKLTLEELLKVYEYSISFLD